jgi:predicted MFS family arabinose efflux permease
VDAHSEPTPPRQPLWTKAFFFVVCVQMLVNYGISTFLLLPKYLSTQLGATAADIGHINAIQGLVAALAVPFVGRLLDRVGRQPLMAAGAALMCVYALAWLSVDHIGPLVYALQAICGLGAMLAFSGSITLITDLAPQARLSQAIGVFGAANISMNALAPAIAESTAAGLGWHVAFAVAAGFASVSLLCSLWVRDPPRPKHTPAAAESGELVLTFRVARQLRLQLLAMCSCGAAFGAVFTFYQPFVLEQGARNVSLFFVGFTLAAVLTRVGLGSLADRYGRRLVARRAFVFYALVVLCMTQLSPSRLFGLGFAFGLAHGFFYPALSALTLEAADANVRGRALTLVTGAFNLGNTLSVMSFGWVANSYGYRTVFVLAALIACFGAGLLYADGVRAAGVQTAPAE